MSVHERPVALLLPAISSIATKDEMRPLALRLETCFRCVLRDWTGFGAPNAGRLSPETLDACLGAVLRELDTPAVGVAAGHGATYLVRNARRYPGRFSRLVLIAPTWRGPLPTMTGGRRPALCRLARTALEAPGLGPLLFGLNVSRPVVGWMMREHVYAEPARVTGDVLDAKVAVTRRPGARFGTAAFITGALDPVASREEFLALFDGDLPPSLMLQPCRAPARSAAEMEALAASGLVEHRVVDGALAPHEECPDEIAGAILAWLSAAE